MDYEDLARQLYQARQTGELIEPLSDREPFSLLDAYQIQDRWLSLREADGEHLVGYKIGFGSQVMREQLHIAAPNYGPLTDSMLLENGAVLGEGVLQPRVEPEVLLELGSDLLGAPSYDQARAAILSARAAIEIVDSVFRDYRFSLEDNTADGSSAAYVVIGERFKDDEELKDVTVELFVEDQSIGTGRGSAAFGDPVEALCWLASTASSRGRPLRAGQLVMTGGLTAAKALNPGERALARFSGAGDVVIERARR